MHVLVVIAHPNPESFSHAIVKEVVRGAESNGHTAEVLDLYKCGFDPVMTMRDMEQFDGVQMPEDVLVHQRLVEKADSMFLVFPVWWYGMPAMMKGWLDRVWSTGWAYHWKHDPEGSLLTPRPCTVFALTGASSSQLDRWGYEPHIQHLWRYGVFGYCGFEPIRITILEDSAWAHSGKHSKHLQTAFDAGRDIGTDAQAKPGINQFLEKGLNFKGERFTNGV